MGNLRKTHAFKVNLKLASYLIGFLLLLTNTLWHYSLHVWIDEHATNSAFSDILSEGFQNNSSQSVDLDAIAQEITSRAKKEVIENSRRLSGNGNTLPDLPNSNIEMIHHSSPSQIPQWMEEYFQWHSEKRAKLNESNYADQKFLLMRCLNIDNKCGGASDRLQTIPAIVLAAYRMQRLLFIKWERPYPLEEFLVAPVNGLNWTLPTWLDQKFTYQSRLEIVNEVHLRHFEDSSKFLIQMRFQSSDYGADYYNAYKPDGPVFDEVFHDCWERLFEPSPAIAALVIESTSKLGLVPGRYTAVHIRSKYMTDKAESRFLVKNAVNCGSQLSNGKPIYVAADDNRAIEFAMAYGASKGGVVVGRTGQQPVLHLDRGVDFLSQNPPEPNSFPPSAYYETFVDFYMLTFSSCLSLHKGGFGRWAKLMMQSSSCIINHGTNACNWATPQATTI